MPKSTKVAIVFILTLSFAVGCIGEQMIGLTDPSDPEQISEGPFDDGHIAPDENEPTAPATETTLGPDLSGTPVRRVPDEGLSEKERQVWTLIEFFRTMPYETSREVSTLCMSIFIGKKRAYETWRTSAESCRNRGDDWYVLDEHYRIKLEFDYDTLAEFALLDSRDDYYVSAKLTGVKGENILGIALHINSIYEFVDFVRRMPQPKSDLFINEFLMADPLDWRCLNSIFEFDEEKYSQSSGMARYFIIGEGYNTTVFGTYDGDLSGFNISKNYVSSTVISVGPEMIPYIRELLVKGSSDPNEPLPDLENLVGLIRERLEE